MNYSGGAPVRQSVPELPENDFPMTPAVEEKQSGERNFLASVRLLWEHRTALLRVAACALVASALIAFLIPPRYESTARLMPPDNQSSAGVAMAAATLSGIGGSGGVAPGGLGSIAADLLGLKSTSEVFVGILKSRTVKDKLIQQFNLQKLYGDRRMEDARKGLADHTDISVDRKSQIISIVVTDKNPQRAAAMGQAYVEELNHLVAELSTSSARRERIFLEGRLQGVSQDLEAAEKEFSQFASKNTAIDVKEQGRAMVQAAAMLQGQLIAAQSQYEGLREIYTDNNSRVRSLKARIDELQRQLEKIGGKGESSTDAFAHSGDSMYPSIRKLPLLGVTYADLYRRMKIQEVVLETLTKQYELARVQEAKELPTVKVLDAAHIPDKKSFPPRLLLIIAGTAFAVGIAATWIHGKTAWDQIDAHDPRKIFAQEVLTTMKTGLPQFAVNGSGNHNGTGKFWRRIGRQRAGSEVNEEAASSGKLGREAK